jgi:6-pyruvoyltetrahydropterin/6-carboxytetrahydropterin synthase
VTVRLHHPVTPKQEHFILAKTKPGQLFTYRRFGCISKTFFCFMENFSSIFRRFLYMYSISSEASFDSAHFLKDYNGKCSNIHGHRWRVIITVCAKEVSSSGQERGMLCDFSSLKQALRRETERLDHTLIYEEGSLRAATLSAMKEEGFSLTPVPFRPTAENFARYFYDLLAGDGYPVSESVVYETPNNCAKYTCVGEMKGNGNVIML